MVNDCSRLEVCLLNTIFPQASWLRLSSRLWANPLVSRVFLLEQEPALPEEVRNTSHQIENQVVNLPLAGKRVR